jgi:acetyl-CoA synthetase (ADP-forming)
MSERDPIAAARAAGRGTLTEAASKTLLEDAGLTVPASTVVVDPATAADAAEEIGFPVVIKVSAPAVVHKSEWGEGAGVAVGLDSREAVEAAARRVFDAAESAGIDANVLVEAGYDADRGTELIVGGLRDRSFGPVVLVGLGGVFAELFEDTAHRLAPIDRGEARAAIGELRGARLLEGFRGRPSADVTALADAVTTVGDLLCKHDAIREVDANPVLASDEGAVVLDALVVLEDGEGKEAEKGREGGGGGGGGVGGVGRERRRPGR